MNRPIRLLDQVLNLAEPGNGKMTQAVVVVHLNAQGMKTKIWGLEAVRWSLYEYVFVTETNMLGMPDLVSDVLKIQLTFQTT